MGKFKLLYETVDTWTKITNFLYLNKNYIIDTYKYNNQILNDFYLMLNKIKKNKMYKPSQKEIINAIIWEIEAGSGKLTYKSGGESLSDKKFESQLTLISIDKKGNDVEKIIIKGKISNDINDVYIHSIDINKLEKIINKNLPKKISKNLFFHMVNTFINAGIKSIATKSGVGFLGKRKTFNSVKEYLKFIDIENNEDIINGLILYKDQIPVYLNNLLKVDKTDIDYDEKYHEIKKELIDYFLKLANK